MHLSCKRILASCKNERMPFAVHSEVGAYIACPYSTKELIAGTDRPITEIAFDVGYNDSNYFSTAFRKHEGLTPSQYRKQG